jgi:cell division protein FtsW
MRQALFLLIGMGLMIFISMFGYKIIKVFTPILFIFSLIMLVLVLVVGVSEGEAKRWIYFGPISVQPSEVMKIALILMIAFIADKYKVTINSKKKFWRASLYGTLFPLILTGVACVLVLLENHLSGTIILFLIGFSLIWANGSPKTWSIALFATIVAAVVFVIVMVDNYPEQVKKLVPDYMFVRVDSWLNPENYDARDELWQTLQGQIAIGSGGFFGRGFGQSLQKHLFVSMPQNDFIFTIICEELGFIGAAVVIALYVAFVARGFYIAKNTPDVFCSVTAVGISAHVGLQALLNIGVVTGVLPNTGISLPFFSAGGSSLVILFFEMGLLLAISKYTPVYEKTTKKRRHWFFWRKEN